MHFTFTSSFLSFLFLHANLFFLLLLHSLLLLFLPPSNPSLSFISSTLSIPSLLPFCILFFHSYSFLQSINSLFYSPIPSVNPLFPSSLTPHFAAFKSSLLASSSSSSSSSTSLFTSPVFAVCGLSYPRLPLLSL